MGTPGEFNWADLMTTDQEGAKRFYEDLFGWTSEDVPAGDQGVYTMFFADDDVVCGCGEYGPDQKEQGMPPVWQPYVTVTDVDATAALAKDLGGTIVMPPMDVMDAGRMAMGQDPAGAFFAVWQDGNHTGATRFDDPVSITWVELATDDTAACEAFYSGLFGWTAESAEFGGTLYTTFRNGEEPAAGMYDKTGVLSDEVPPSWTVYFGVADTDSVLARAEALGGSVVAPAMDLEGVGRFAVVGDPQGGVFAVLQAPAES